MTTNLSAKERLAYIFDSKQCDVITRTNTLKAQASQIEIQEKRIKELEELVNATRAIKKEKTTRQKKTLTDEEKQALKERLALGKKKKQLEKQESSDKPEQDEPKPQETTKSKPKTKMTSDDIDIDDLLNKMNERLKQKALEKQKETKAEPEKAKPEPEKVKHEPAKPKAEPEMPQLTKYNRFLKNVSKPKYY